LKRQWN